jgi:hypothetical protein
VALALLEKELNDINAQFRRFRETYLIRRRRAGLGLADSKHGELTCRNNLSDRRITVKNGYCFATSDSAKIFTESGLQFGDPDLSHSILTDYVKRSV